MRLLGGGGARFLGRREGNHGQGQGGARGDGGVCDQVGGGGHHNSHGRCGLEAGQGLQGGAHAGLGPLRSGQTDERATRRNPWRGHCGPRFLRGEAPRQPVMPVHRQGFTPNIYIYIYIYMCVCVSCIGSDVPGEHPCRVCNPVPKHRGGCKQDSSQQDVPPRVRFLCCHGHEQN